MKEYEVGYADLWIGKNVDRRRVVLDGKGIEDYLFAHAPSRILYDIPAGFTKFEVWGIRTHGEARAAGSGRVMLYWDYGSWLRIGKIAKLGETPWSHVNQWEKGDYSFPYSILLNRGPGWLFRAVADAFRGRSEAFKRADDQ